MRYCFNASMLWILSEMLSQSFVAQVYLLASWASKSRIYQLWGCKKFKLKSHPSDTFIYYATFLRFVQISIII